MPHSRSSQDSCAQDSSAQGRRSQDSCTRDAAYRIHTPANYVTFVRILLVPVWLALAEFQMSIAPLSLNPYLAACINIDIASGNFMPASAYIGSTTANGVRAWADVCTSGGCASVLAFPDSLFLLLSWVSFVFFCLLCLSDKLDGYLARSRGEVTVLGKFLDPIADKILVIVALVFLLEYHGTTSWTILVIVGRELLVSALRMLVASEGKVVAASGLGKAKTATTMAALCALLSLPLWRSPIALSFVGIVGSVLMFIAVILTLISGIDYVIKSWSVICHDRTHASCSR